MAILVHGCADNAGEDLVASGDSLGLAAQQDCYTTLAADISIR
jgi:hypothetical protein